MLLEEQRVAMSLVTSPKVVMLYIWERPEDMQIMLITILWVLWSERNGANAVENIKQAGQVCGCIRRFLQDFMAASQIYSVSGRIDQTTWQKPLEGYLKINVNGAFRDSTASGGSGFIIRDNQGGAVAAGAGNLQHLCDPAQAEVEACLQALNLQMPE